MKRQASSDFSPDDVSKMLNGLGEAEVYVESGACRFRLPQKYKKKLAPPLLAKPWRLSLWRHGCIRATPLDLWEAYLKYLAAHELSDYSANLASSLVEASSSDSVIRPDYRWNIPRAIYDRSKCAGKSTLCLIPNRFWIEIWVPDLLGAHLSKLQGEIPPAQ